MLTNKHVACMHMAWVALWRNCLLGLLYDKLGHQQGEHDERLSCSRPISEGTPSQIRGFTIHNVYQRLLTVMLIMWYTLLDLMSCLLRVKWMNDSELPIRGGPGVEWMPKVTASASFTMQDIQRIKMSVGGVIYQYSKTVSF